MRRYTVLNKIEKAPLSTLMFHDAVSVFCFATPTFVGSCLRKYPPTASVVASFEKEAKV